MAADKEKRPPQRFGVGPSGQNSNFDYTIGNAWNNTATGVNGTSTAHSTTPITDNYVQGWGTVSGPTTITFQFSNDDFAFDIVDGNSVTVPSAHPNFGLYDLVPIGKTSVRLKSSANVTATAQISPVERAL